MPRNFLIVSITISVIIGLSLLVGLVVANTVIIHSQPMEKEFLVPWLAARTFLQYGDNPFGVPASQRAQIVYYGKLASPGQDPLFLWLPFPVELLYFPFALISDYVVARAIWLTLLEIALVASGFFALKLCEWKPARFLIPIILLFPLIWVYGGISLSNANGIGLVAFSLLGFLYSIRKQKDELAGFLFFFLFCAPRITGVLILFLIWWIISTRRWRIFGGFFMVFFLLLILSFFFLPNWLPPFIEGAISHSAFTPVLSSWQIFSSWSPVVGLRLGWFITIVLLFMLFIEWGITIRKDFRHLLWTISLTLAAIPLTGIPISFHDFNMMFFPLIFFLAVFNERWSRQKKWGFAGYFLIFILVISWFFTALFDVSGSITELKQFLFLFLPMILIPGLYWMRWWIFRSKQVELISLS